MLQGTPQDENTSIQETLQETIEETPCDEGSLAAPLLWVRTRTLRWILGKKTSCTKSSETVREQPKLSQLIGYCVIEYLKLERKRKFKYTCPYDQLLCMGFTAFGARGFLPSIHLRVLVRTHNITPSFIL